MEPQPFLSDTWLAQVRAVKDQHVGGRIDTPGLIMNATITGVPFGDPVRHLHSEHGPVIGWEAGHHDSPVLTIHLDYALARELLTATSYDVLDQAVTSGSLRIDGERDQLRAWWGQRIGNPDAVALDEQIRGLTT